MMQTYAKQPTLVNAVLDYVFNHPNYGVTLAQIVNHLSVNRPQSKKQSVPPTLNHLKHIGLVKRDLGLWWPVK